MTDYEDPILTSLIKTRDQMDKNYEERMKNIEAFGKIKGYEEFIIDRFKFEIQEELETTRRELTARIDRRIAQLK